MWVIPSEEMTKQYTDLSEEYARKTVERINGLCGVSVGLGNKLESLEKDLILPQNPSLSTA
jgi:hypothetical protein